MAAVERGPKENPATWQGQRYSEPPVEKPAAKSGQSPFPSASQARLPLTNPAPKQSKVYCGLLCPIGFSRDELRARPDSLPPSEEGRPQVRPPSEEEVPPRHSESTKAACSNRAPPGPH